MAERIQNHQDGDDIQKIFIGWDIINWKEKLETIEEEMTLFANLLSAHLASALDNKSGYKNVFFKLEKFKESNTSFQESLIAYNRQLEGLKECEDLQCETYFLNGHTEFKSLIEDYFSQYRSLKKTIFSKLNNEIKNKTAKL